MLVLHKKRIFRPKWLNLASSVQIKPHIFIAHLNSLVEDMQATLRLFSWVWAIPGKRQREGTWIHILFWTLRPPTTGHPDFFRFVNLLLSSKLLPQPILSNCVTFLQDLHPIFLAKFRDSPWLYGTHVP